MLSATQRDVAPQPSSDPIARGFEYLAKLQTGAGSWMNDYSGPLFLLPGYVFAHFATKTPISAKEREKCVAYIRSAQRADGGFGLHVESRSFLFTTVLNYVALRLLGEGPDEPAVARARAFIQRRGGALGVATWGKIWLSILRLYDWEGVTPILPELWLMPDAVPIHPGKWWCHCRVIYLPTAYLYGRRWQVPDEPLLAEIRAEIYDRPYEDVDFQKGRELIDPEDVYVPHSALLRGLNRVLGAAEPLIPGALRRRALELTLDHVRHEQESTSFIDIGPVNKAFDTIAVYAADPEGEHTKKAIAALELYAYDDEEGHGEFMQSYNSCELWDTAFAVQALAASGRIPRFSEMAERAYRFIDENQVREDVAERERYYRDPSRGGWPFSNLAHGWPISDCTAEGIKAHLALEPFVTRPIPADRIQDAVDLLLFWQNDDGGWATYEKRRGNRLIELLNPAELFGDIMTDYSYPECSSSAIQALVAARRRYGKDLGRLRSIRVGRSIDKGARFLREIQRPDGSFEGSWAICFTYGTWFGVTGLAATGATAEDPAVARAISFLLEKQLPDGGWGESYESCVERRYVQHPEGSRVVMTAWALLALLAVPCDRTRDAIARGVRLLLSRQLEDGDFPNEGVNGVFNRTTMLKYRFYRNYFPLWALALAEKQGYLRAP